jgi:hypothetical protein
VVYGVRVPVPDALHGRNKVRHSLLILLFATALTPAQTITLPKEVKGDPNTFIRVPADTEGKEVRWYSPDKGLAVFPVDLLRDSKTCVVVAGAKGRYRLIAWTAKGDVPSLHAECAVLVGEPGPGPEPPPQPDSPLAKAIKAALEKEAATDKVASLMSLADLYTSSAEQVKATTLTKLDEYGAALRKARVALIGEKIPLIREEIHRHVSAAVPPVVGASLDAAAREKLSKAFTEIAHALRACCP